MNVFYSSECLFCMFFIPFTAFTFLLHCFVHRQYWVKGGCRFSVSVQMSPKYWVCGRWTPSIRAMNTEHTGGEYRAYGRQTRLPRDWSVPSLCITDEYGDWLKKVKPVKGGYFIWIIYSDGQKRPLEETSKMKWSDQTGTTVSYTHLTLPTILRV